MTVLHFPSRKRTRPLRAEEEELLATLRALLDNGRREESGEQNRRLTSAEVISLRDGWSRPSCPTTSSRETATPSPAAR